MMTTPALLAALKDAIACADGHPEEARSIDEVRALNPPMDFRVEISDPAIADLAEIVSYIAQDNPEAARGLGNNLLDAAPKSCRNAIQRQPLQENYWYPKTDVAAVQNLLSCAREQECSGGSSFWHSAQSELDV